MIRVSALAVFLVVVAGAESAGADGLPVSGVLPCGDKGVEPCVYSDRESGLELRIPIDWPTRHLQVVTDSGPGANARQKAAQRWFAFEYVPVEPSYPQVALFELVVFSRADWYRIAVESAPLPGIEVAATRAHTFVAALSQANPYPPESRDGQIYAALLPNLESVSLIVTATEIQ